APVIPAEAETSVHVQPLTDLPAAPVAAAPVPAAPLSRRARRAPLTTEQPAVLAPAEPFELLEPVLAPVTEEVVLEVVPDETPVAEPTVVAEPVTAEPVTAEPVTAAESAEPRVEASAVDDFEAAARLFSFT